MKRKISFVFAIIGWLAILTSYFLMIKNRVAPVAETTIRFFSFFTILTNLLITIYFSYHAITRNFSQKKIFGKPGSLSAIAVYITIVGLVYQVTLRHIWNPTGLQMIVEEVLHLVIPVCVIAFWYFFENKKVINWGQIPKWLIYPLIYLIYVLLRGKISGFYPYPFINVSVLGLQRVLQNSIILVALFLTFSMIFVGIGKLLSKNKRTTSQ